MRLHIHYTCTSYILPTSKDSGKKKKKKDVCLKITHNLIKFEIKVQKKMN